MAAKPESEPKYHDRRVDRRRRHDPEYRAEYERFRRQVGQIDAVVKALDDLRDRAGLSKAELARRIGKDPASVRRFFTDQVNPELKTIAAIAEALDAEVVVQARGMSRRPRPRPAAADHLAGQLAGVVQAVVAGDQDGAREQLAPVAFNVFEVQPRPALTPAVMVQVFRRDRFLCRYCGRRTVAPPVLRLISTLFPAEFPRHPNWKMDETHIAYWTIFASCDHVVPGSRSGDWSDLSNLVTACWPCNSAKSSHALEDLGWQLGAIDEGATWDGLIAAYPELWTAAGRPEPRYHRPWLNALASSPAST